MIERFRHAIFSSKYTLQERLFILSALGGSSVMLAMFVLTIMSGQRLIIASSLAMGSVMLVASSIYAFRTKRFTLGGSIIVLISNCLVFPFGYIMGGGVHSGSPIWFIPCVIFVFLIFRGRLLIIYLVISIVSFGVTTYLSYLHPEWVVPLAGEYAVYADTCAAAVLVGVLAGMVLSFQGIVLEEENQRVQEQNKEIEKLIEAQNRFFSSMSHEIRTPINSIIGLNEMTLRDKDLPSDITENALNIQTASRMLLGLVNDILDLSKIESGSMEVVEGQYETTRMLSEIVGLLWGRARDKGLRFDVNIGERIPSMLYGDEMRIKQVIINLLTNAIKYTAEGSVTLTVGGEEPEANRFLLRVDVEDTGIGIRKENIPYLFDSFKRVDEQDIRTIEGTGLGLSIAKQLTELMGGHISVDSIYTKGSTFHVEIPQKIINDTPISFQSITEVTKETGTYRKSFEAPGAHVLIVDDNEMNRLVAAKLLRDTLVKVDVAASGAECLAMTAENHYDVIFMDHEMPEMDGIETLGKIRTQQNGLCRTSPVVALTANAGSDMHDFYIGHGFSAYLAKPIHSSLLEATLLQLLPGELLESAPMSTEEEKRLYVGQSFLKRSIMITTDCVCDLPEDVIGEYGIRLMPFYVITRAGRFRDTEEIDADNLFAYIGDSDEVVMTASSEMEEYEAFFADALADADSVIHISVSSQLSHGYEKACKAADSFSNVYVVDSKNLSSGLGMVALQAARMAMAGEGVNRILSAIEQFIPLVQTSFIVTRPGTIMRRRKMPWPVKAVTEVFGFDPVFRVRGGKLLLKSFKAGYITDPFEQYIKEAMRDKDRINPRLLFVTYSGVDQKERDEILETVRRTASFDEVIMQKASATVSSQCGKHSFGLIYAKRAQR